MAFWKWDTAEFTLDSILYTFDGKIPAEEGWRWDTEHFTLDSDTHTFDGYHDDTITPEATNERGTWYGFQERYRLKRLHEEDGALMDVIHSFLKEAA